MRSKFWMYGPLLFAAVACGVIAGLGSTIIDENRIEANTPPRYGSIGTNYKFPSLRNIAQSDLVIKSDTLAVTPDEILNAAAQQEWGHGYLTISLARNKCGALPITKALCVKYVFYPKEHSPVWVAHHVERLPQLEPLSKVLDVRFDRSSNTFSIEYVHTNPGHNEAVFLYGLGYVMLWGGALSCIAISLFALLKLNSGRRRMRTA